MEEREEGRKECPLCASRNISYSEREKALVCRDCGSVIAGTPIVIERPKEEVVREILPTSIIRKKEALAAKLAKKKGKLAKKGKKAKPKKAKKKTVAKKAKKSSKKSKPKKKGFLKRLLRRR